MMRCGEDIAGCWGLLVSLPPWGLPRPGKQRRDRQQSEGNKNISLLHCPELCHLSGLPKKQFQPRQLNWQKSAWSDGDWARLGVKSRGRSCWDMNSLSATLVSSAVGLKVGYAWLTGCVGRFLTASFAIPYLGRGDLGIENIAGCGTVLFGGW